MEISTKTSPQWKNPQCTSHDHCSTVGHILRQKVFYMLSRAVQCCYFFHGASTKCTFQLASYKYRSHPWICFHLPPAAVLRMMRQSLNWHWLVPGCGQCPHSQRPSQLCPPVVPNLTRKRTDLIKAIMEVALHNILP